MAMTRMPAVKRVLKHFRGMIPDEVLPTSEDMEILLPERGRGGLLLDHYTPDEVLEALGRYGVAPKLALKGFEDLGVDLATSDRRRQVVQVNGVREGRRVLLGEAILRADTFSTQAPFATELAGLELKILFIQWLRIQDPTREFTVERPRLPGQDHPGLGAGREVMAMLLGLSTRRGYSGIMVCPEFAHNAVLYEKQFRFFDPEAQGRFEALVKSFEGLTLAQSAWAVENGCVLDAASGTTFRWFHEEMVRATTGVLHDHLESRQYADRLGEARARYSYRIDRDKLASSCC